jgi:hypothetical protein
MNDLIWVPIVGFIIVAGGGAAGVLYMRQLDKRKGDRTAAIRKIAPSMSLSFVGDTQRSYFSSIARFPLFQLGNGGHLYQNLITGKCVGFTISIFDYSYISSTETPNGRRDKFFNHTAVCFVDERLNLPEFELRPEGIAEKLLSAFKMEDHPDIDFSDYPQFSKRFLLRGPYRDRIAGLFTEPVISHFEQVDGKLYVEGEGENLMIYVTRHVAPSEMQAFCRQCQGVHSCIVDSVRDS